MSRAIKIIDTSGFYWTVSIDGIVIQLGKRLCRVDFGNADNLNSVLKDIEDIFIWRHTFSDVQSRTNTFNLLIDAQRLRYSRKNSGSFQYRRSVRSSIPAALAAALAVGHVKSAVSAFSCLNVILYHLLKNERYRPDLSVLESILVLVCTAL